MKKTEDSQNLDQIISKIGQHIVVLFVMKLASYCALLSQDGWILAFFVVCVFMVLGGESADATLCADWLNSITYCIF